MVFFMKLINCTFSFSRKHIFNPLVFFLGLLLTACSSDGDNNTVPGIDLLVAPTLVITAPTNNSSFIVGDTITFSGTANDPEDSDISAAIIWTSDLDGEIGNGANFNLSTLSEGSHNITAEVTDSGELSGFDTINITVDPLINMSPVVTITSPANNSSFSESDDITFVATADDLEDGDISTTLTWNSNLDGEIGNGESFNLSTLSIATHTITASVNGSNAPGDDSITLFILPVGDGATYYISTADSGGSDDNDGSIDSPWATFNYAMGKLQPGNTLIVRNGIYSESLQVTVSGSPGQPTTIKGESFGGVIIDVDSDIAIELGSDGPMNDIVVENFIATSRLNTAVMVQSPDGTSVRAQTRDITLRNIGARGGSKDDNKNVFTMARIKDSLAENIFTFGDGRYSFSLYGTTNVTVRNLVSRWDRWDGLNSKPEDPKHSFSIYDGIDNTLENAIFIDVGDNAHGAILLAGNGNGGTAPYEHASNNKLLGVIVLNNTGLAIGDESGASTNDNNYFENFVLWSNSRNWFSANKNAANTQLNHFTVSANEGPDGAWVGSNNVSNIDLTNSLIFENTGRIGNFDDVISVSETADPELNHILYIPPASVNYQSGSDGGNIGATVINKYKDGIKTSEALWPWENQELIKNWMCDSDYLLNIGRSDLNEPGWCETSKTLTQYIWEYLGHPIPDPIPTE